MFGKLLYKLNKWCEKLPYGPWNYTGGTCTTKEMLRSIYNDYPLSQKERDKIEEFKQRREGNRRRETTPAPKQAPQKAKYTAELLASTKRVDQDAQYFGIKGGKYYILEIVRPRNQSSGKRYGDPVRSVNGVLRVVSTQKMYVRNVYHRSSMLVLECVGYDNFCRPDNNNYIFYQSPDSQNMRDEYILSITEA